MAILNGNKYSLPYSNSCRLVLTVGSCKVYKLKQKDGVVYGVMRGRKVLCFAATLKEAKQFLGVDN